jgi:Ca2+-binding EF-hand superfamily protein
MHVNSIFRKYDTDGSGTIDTSELGTLCGDLGFNLSEEDPRALEVVALIVDKNGDNTINFEEFYAWWSAETSRNAVLDEKHREKVSHFLPQ